MRYRELLQEALDEDVGTGVLCKGKDGADKLRRQLYMERLKAREEGDRSFDSLSLSISPSSPEVLFIYHPERTGEPDG